MAPFGGIERRASIVILISLLVGLGILGIRAAQATGGAAGDAAENVVVAGDSAAVVRDSVALVKDSVAAVNDSGAVAKDSAVVGRDSMTTSGAGQLPDGRGGGGGSGANGAVAASGVTELPAPTEIMVHVCGAVRNPGVYRLAPSSRVADAVAAAGGGTTSAYFERINLASPIFDGQQIYVPIKDEHSPAGNGKSGDERSLPAARSKTVSPAAPASALPSALVPAPAPASVRAAVPGSAAASAPGFTAAAGSATSAGLIDLNTCSNQDLTTLKGIGPVLAQRIIEYRAQHGRFMSVDDLLEVPGIGPKKLESIRPYVGIR